MPTRTQRSVRNVVAGVATKVGLLAAGFVTRTVFVHELGVELLGVNALLLSVVMVLSIAELGVNTAFMYALYGPLARGDQESVSSIVTYARRVYRYVAGAILGLGLLVLPDPGSPGDVPDGRHILLYFGELLVDAAVLYLVTTGLRCSRQTSGLIAPRSTRSPSHWRATSSKSVRCC